MKHFLDWRRNAEYHGGFFTKWGITFSYIRIGQCTTWYAPRIIVTVSPPLAANLAIFFNWKD